MNERTRQASRSATVPVAGSHEGPTRSTAVTGAPPSLARACADSTTEVGTVSRLTSVIASVVSPEGTVSTGASAALRSALVVLHRPAALTSR